ncbi:MAG: UDP-N-acetylmuramoyl-L-alanyl-D-glutamate--2,6-diaminopimelate ligase [Neomegalonema sp.]|nr:UDP-N-acetylmuramoyl-L-alanyl-D-glutamate--2,6-diaminopimelate ligase [Neomegalonema sp.]
MGCDRIEAATQGLRGALILGPPPPDSFSDLAVDSRAVREGGLFVAIKGDATDGALYAGAAVAKGAKAILCDLAGALRIRERLGAWPVTMFVAPDPRRRLAQLARALRPEQPRNVVAVTGTNGKTSVASFAAQLFGALGRGAATFGTAGMQSWNLAAPFSEPISHTTLEPIAFHNLMQRLAGAGVTHVAMEASSHGLAQYRVDGADIAAAALTNITRDHLDYHEDAADYAAAKLRLFSEVVAEGGAAVLNADDPSFDAVFAVATARGLRTLPVGHAAAGGDAIQILGETPDASGIAIEFRYAGVIHRKRLPLIGAFQGANALAAAGLAISVGEAPGAVFDALEGLSGVRGRMELAARRANGAGVFVDYAHTPDALAVALSALRPHTEGRLHVVFGAGGDRDPGKRPLMGQAAAAHADRVVVTDDNPRSEDPAAIRAAILTAAPEAIEIGDRAEAILRGVDGLESGDVLLIAGKGHEQGQIIGGEVTPFDDVEQARAAVGALDGAAGQIGAGESGRGSE